MSQPLPPEQPNPAQQQRVQLVLPKDLDAVYANIAFIANSPAEIVIDFAQMLPRSNKGKVMSRVVMSPMHAKLLQLALTQNVANYEKQFGEIRIPRRPSIADQFFRYSQDDGGKDDGGKEDGGE
jgi:hypothetical protein